MHIKALSSKSLCMARKRIPALSRVFTWQVASMRLNFNNIMSRILEWVNVVRNARQKLVNIALHAKQQGMLSERERDVKKLLDWFTFFKTAYWLSSPSFIIKWFLSKRQCWCLWKHNISYNESSVSPFQRHRTPKSFVVRGLRTFSVLSKAVIVFITFHIKILASHFQKQIF